MKKKIALLLAAAMVVGSLPMTAFASTDNNVSKIPTVEVDDPFTTTIVIDEFEGVVRGQEKQTIKLTLTGAEWKDMTWGTVGGSTSTVITAKKYAESDGELVAMTADGQRVSEVEGGVAAYYKIAGKDMYFQKSGDEYYEIESPTSEIATETVTTGGVKYTYIGDKQAFAEFDAVPDGQTVQLTLKCKAKEEGDATVTIDPTDSVVSAETLKIANVTGGATTMTISDTTSIKETATKIKNIVIEETTAGSIEVKENTGVASIKLKLSNGFKWAENPENTTTSVVVFPSDAGFGASGTFRIDPSDEQVAYIDLKSTRTDDAGKYLGSSKDVSVSLVNPGVYYDDDDAEIGDECEVTVSEAGTTKESILVGTAADYGVNFTIYKDEELPVFYSGTFDEDTDTLTVKIKENIANSWLTNRKTKIIFPEGVEVMGVDEDYTSNITVSKYAVDENEVTITASAVKDSKAELRLYFQLSISPDFTGDITATLTGSGVDEDVELTVGKAEFPVTIDADVNELMIDYRNTGASDIVITEADAGALKKDTYVALQIDGIDFDGDPTVEVESGDMKIESVKTDSDGLLTFKIKTESQKEAATIRISDIELYMERSLPAGEYDLKVVSLKDAADAEAVTDGKVEYTGLKGESGLSDKDAIIRNYNDGDDDETGLFDVDEVTVLDGYVTIVTAGREQDDSTFTTKVTVTIGANTMMAGTKEIALDVPAYIANGYTMLPVRAVTEALSGSAIVRWDDASKTVTITFGQRVINMTVGSRTMVINGVNVAMQAACEITDSRAFIPLRDLGYALGLNDSKIAWDDATKTATLN